jgi:hypothetical protein
VTATAAEGSPALTERSFAERVRAALVLDATVYAEAAQDGGALLQAGALVVAAGLARGVGALAQEGWLTLIASPIAGLVVWVVSAAVIWAIGAKGFGLPVDVRQLLRSLGFAAAPLLALALRAIPVAILSPALFVLAHGAAIFALVLAVRETLRIDTQRALLVCAFALAMSLLALFLLGILFVGGAAEAAAALSASS